MKNTQIKAVLFDLDGTLLDTAPEFVVVVNRLRDEHRLPPLTAQLIRTRVSHGARAMVSLALDITEADAKFEQNRLRLLEMYSQSLGEHTTAFGGIIALLSWLEDRDIDWGISTNKPSYLAVPLLEKMKLKPAPKTIVCPDHVTQTKPHPEPLLLNCKHLNCQPQQAVYIGDHLRDIQAGNSAGMHTIAAAYGYLNGQEDPKQWRANSIALSSTELQSLIEPLL